MGYRLGVDLGTTYTAAAVNVDGRTEMLGLGIRAMQVPSVVFVCDDGEIVVRFPAATDGETFTIPPGVDLARQRARVFADPHADPDGLPPIRLRHPEGGATRV